MSDLQSSPPEFPRRAAQRPRCPRCQASMAIQRAIPARSGFEHWTLRCSKCGHIDEAQVHVDPMNSCALGWLHGVAGAAPVNISLGTVPPSGKGCDGGTVQATEFPKSVTR